MKVILGSASPRRREILKEMGYEFDVMTADIDEKSIKDADPEKLVLRLARAKAESLLPKIKEPSILITADLVVVFQGKILEKPESIEEAKEMMLNYKNEAIETVCAVVVTNTLNRQRTEGVDISKLVFNNLPEGVINEFAESGEALGHSGAFAAENPLFKPYVKILEGTIDSIAGLPKALTERLIKQVEN